MMRMFEQEMGLGPSLGAHIPSFIAEGLAQLRSAPAGHFDTKEPVKKEFSEARKENSQPDEGEADNFVATLEEKKEAEANVYKKQKDDGRINGQGQKRNIQFERYYRQLNVVTPQEWTTFYEKLKIPLDICFRVNTIGQYKDDTKATLDDHIAKMAAEETLCEKTPQEVLWYPSSGMVYTFNELSRVELRQNPKLK